MAKRTEERAEFLSCIIITALEGGIGYWSECLRYKWQGREKDVVARIEIPKDEAHEGQTEFDLNNDVIAKGIGRVKNKEFKVAKYILQAILSGDRDNDGCDIDSDAADVIVQAALFGEIVYG